MASIYANLWTKRKHLHKKRVQLLKDCFGIPIWPPWRHVKTPKRVFSQDVMSAILCGVTWQWNGGWDIGVANPVFSFVPRKFAQLLGTCVKRLYRVFSLMWPASVQIYWNERKRLHKKRVQLPEDCFGTPTWPPFHCFGTPTWRRDVMWKHSIE